MYAKYIICSDGGMMAGITVEDGMMNAKAKGLQVEKAQSTLVRLKVPAKALAAAMVCMAKMDVRYYLNGVRINRSRISGTNGHVMYDHKFKSPILADDSLPLDGELIIRPQSAVPASAHEAVIDVHGDYALIRYYRVDLEFIKADYATIIDGKYVDVDRITSKLTDEPESVTHMRFNQGYLALSEKVFGKFSGYKGVVMTFHGPNAFVHFEHDDPETGKHHFVAMPMSN